MAGTHSRGRRRVAAVAATLLTLTTALVGLTAVGSAPIGATEPTPVSWTVSSTAGQFILKKGDPTYQRTIDNPSVQLVGSFNEETNSATATGTFLPSYTPNIAGPFSLIIYIKAQIIQVTPFTGTIANDGTVDVTGSAYLAITVYRTKTGTVGLSDGQNPATDQILANGSTCRSLIDMHLTGTFDINARSLTLGQDPFTIPNFPADTRPSGTAGCATTTSAINQQLAGASNSVSLTFGGTLEAAKPEAPGRVTAVPGDGTATLNATYPADYGSPITSWTVTPYIGATAQPTQVIPFGGSPVITGLTNGTTYTFKVAATNANGTGPASAASNAITVGAPGRPAFQSALSQAGGASVKFWAPSGNGSPVTGYTVTPYIAGVAQATQSFGPGSNVLAVTGLTPGTTYTFTVSATNARGTSNPSLQTNAVVPS